MNIWEFQDLNPGPAGIGYHAFANSVDLDQLAWRSQLIWPCTFVIKYVNLYQQPG